MKKYILIFLLSSITVTFSYGQTDNESQLEVKNKPLASDEFEYFGKIVKLKKGELKWEAQLSMIVADNEHFKESKLALKNYNFVRKIKTIQEFEKIVLDELLNENSLFPVYEGNSNIFTLEPLNKISERDRYESTLKSILLYNVSNNKSNLMDAFVFNANEWGLVELEWEYESKKFKSSCIVSDKYGVLYDNLTVYIHITDYANANFNSIKNTKNEE
ncbi:MAG: hypothetical protein LBO74_07615 [Candidatus Symbiothrix sp.]|jgi:hypothetical protein|nr:hypothetical protein [Candidatus Symbiothrix sp.]